MARRNALTCALLHGRAKERLEEDERMRKACASAPVMQDLQPVLQKVQVKVLQKHMTQKQ